MVFKLIFQNSTRLIYQQFNLAQRVSLKNLYSINLLQYEQTVSSIYQQTRSFIIHNNRNCDIRDKVQTNGKIENDIDVDLITGGDEDLKKRLQILILEVDMCRHQALLVPDTLKTKDWIELLNLKSKSQQRKFLTYLFKLEKKNENFKIKKEQKRQLKEAKKLEPRINDGLIYGLNSNTIFMRIYDRAMTHLDNNRLKQAMLFNQKIVIDCSYGNYMTMREAKNCAKQLMYLFSENRLHNEPFDIHFCNANRNDFTMQAFHKYIPIMYDEDFPINITDKHYLDLFPKKNLIYLTPHCRTDLEVWDHDAIYIIGAMVDKTNNTPLSLAKAKEFGIKYAKLPLERYLRWGTSGKSLTLNQMIQILLTMRTTGNWKEAFKFVPTRKLFSEKDEMRDQKKFKRRTHF